MLMTLLISPCLGPLCSLSISPKHQLTRSLRRRKNPASSKPKTLKIARESYSIKQTETRHAKEPVATADSTKSTESSESTEELRNQTKSDDAEKDQQHHAHESQTSECLNFTQPHGSLNHYQKSPKGLGSSLLDQEMTNADSDLESMPDDEIRYVSGFEDGDEDDFENAEDLSVANEAVADDVIDELVDMTKSQDANLNVFAAKTTNSDPLGHLQANITSLEAKVNNLESSLP
nr:hypothetical protein [Tanacetum cinerariifolium]